MDHYFTNNENLKSEIKNLNYTYNEYDFTFLSDNGVFAKNHIDYGSKLLVETFLKHYAKEKKILDMGCGYGFMGLVIAKVTGADVTMVDVNKRAVHLTNRNIDNLKIAAKSFVSNIYENITEKYDVIITNPPIRAGKKVLLDILIGAKKYLSEDGSLWYVMRKDQGAKSMEKILNEHYKVQLIEKDKGFYIYCCKNH